MPDPNPRQGGRPDPYLTNISLGWAEANAASYAARQVFPQVPVSASFGKYKVWGRSYFLRDEVGPRPLGGYPRQVGYRDSSDSFTTDEEALEAVIDDRERADQVNDDDIEKSKIRLLTAQHLVHGDRRWAAAYFKPGVWGTNLTGVAAAPGANQFLQWDNANSDPMLLLDEQGGLIGDRVGDMWRPNKLVLGRLAAMRLRNHPVIRSRLGTQKDQILTNSDLARFFGLSDDGVVVPGGIVNTGPEMESFAATEAAAVYQRIVSSKDALLVYANPNPSKEMPSGGYTFAWRGLLGADAANPLSAVERGRDDRAKSDWFHVRTAYDFKVVAPELGVFFSGAVA